MIAGGAAFATAIHWAMAHTHNARILALEQKASDIDNKVVSVTTKVENMAPGAIAQAVPIVKVIDPKVDEQVAAKQKQIDEINTTIAELKGKIDAINAAIPKTS